MFSIRMLLMVASPLALLACDSSFDPFPDGFGTPDVVITWEGTVTSSVDGAPIEDVTVAGYVEHDDGTIRGHPFMSPTYTDSLGSYSMKRTACTDAEGPYLQARAQGWQDSERVYVTCEPAVQRIDFVLDPSP